MIVENGKIAAVGANLPVPDTTPTLRVDGLHVYPGLIDAGASIGLIEIAALRATDDLGDSGQFQADLRAGIAVNPDSRLIPVARAGGITATLCLPTGGGNMTSPGRVRGAIIPGQTSVIQLAGWTTPEMVQSLENGLQLIWPSGSNRKTPIEDLKRHLKEARLYDKARTTETESKSNQPPILIDPRYEALRPYVRGEKSVFIEAVSKQEIVEALQFAEQEKLKVVLCGVSDGWKVADKIKAANVPVIVGPVMHAPTQAYDPFDATYANAGRLHEAGVKLCFRSETASNSRNVPFEAAMAVAYGLPEKEALRGVTAVDRRNPGNGRQHGVADTGEIGQRHHHGRFATATDNADQRDSDPGQTISTQSRQTRLYEKYRARLGSKSPDASRFSEAE